MAKIEVLSKSSSSITVHVIELDSNYNKSTRMAVWYLDGVEDGDVYLKNQITEGGDYQFTGLDPETEYEISCTIWYEDHVGNFVDTELDAVTVTTNEGSAGYELRYTDLDLIVGPLDVNNNPIFSTTEDSWIRKMELYCVKCSFTEDCKIVFYSNSGNENMDLVGYYTTNSEWDETDGEPYISKDDIDDVTDDEGQDYSDTATAYDFGAAFDVEAGKTYYLWWKLFDDSPNGSYTVYVKKYTGGSSSNISLWSWKASNGSASIDQTVLAHEALTGHGPISDFSYKVWNDLVDKIYEAQGYWMTDGTGGLTYNNTRMSSTDKTLTANRFNSMKYNLGRNYSTGIADVESGDPVLGSYFITITNKLNAWIETL